MYEGGIGGGMYEYEKRGRLVYTGGGSKERCRSMKVRRRVGV